MSNATRRSGFRRCSIIGLALVALAGGVSSAPAGAQDVVAAPAGLSREDAEAGFVAAINQLRSSQGLGPLRVEPILLDASRQWSAQMIALPRRVDGSRMLEHDPAIAACGANPATCSVGRNWKGLGENVGYGPIDVRYMHQRFVDSPLHYKNLVNPEYDAVGIGVVYDGQVMYITQKFLADPTVTVASPVALAASSGSAGRPVTTKRPRVVRRTTKPA